jgi:signal transduction histidine kinase
LATRVRALLSAVRERRRAEEQGQKLAREQAARAEAEAGVKARDRFLSIASHELRTPLNPLHINVQLLLRAARTGALREGLSGKLLGVVESCDRQLKQFGQLIDNLLDISRIAAGRLDLRIEEVDLAAVTREVVGRFGPELAQAGCPLALRADAQVVGRWDRLRLEQVVTNLLANAVKYGKGKPIEVEVRAGAEAAHLIVRDQGIGIAPEDQGRIFERFERAVSGYEYGGLGMGLYIVRQILDALGGSVRVASAPGAARPSSWTCSMWPLRKGPNQTNHRGTETQRSEDKKKRGQEWNFVPRP